MKTGVSMPLASFRTTILCRQRLWAVFLLVVLVRLTYGLNTYGVETTPNVSSDYASILRDNWKTIETGTLKYLYEEMEDGSDDNPQSGRAGAQNKQAEIANDPSLSDSEKKASLRAWKAMEQSWTYSKEIRTERVVAVFDSRTKRTREESERELEKHLPQEAGKGESPSVQREKDKECRICSGEEGVFYYQATQTLLESKKNFQGFEKYLPWFGLLKPTLFEKEGGSISQETVDGRDLLSFSYPDGSSFLLDPGVGFRFRRVQLRSKGIVYREEIADNYRVFDGIPIPTYYQKTDFYGSDRGGGVRKQLTIAILDAAFNRPIDSTLFELAYPDAVRVMNSEAGSTRIHRTEDNKPVFLYLNEFLKENEGVTIETLKPKTLLAKVETPIVESATTREPTPEKAVFSTPIAATPTAQAQPAQPITQQPSLQLLVAMVCGIIIASVVFFAVRRRSRKS